MSETLLVSGILAALEPLPDVLAFRNNTGVARKRVRYGLGNGAPDIVAIIAPWGHLLGIEVKLPGCDAEPDQIAWADRARRHGASYCLVRSVPEALSAVAGVRAMLRAGRYALPSGNALPSSNALSALNAELRACTNPLSPCERRNGSPQALTTPTASTHARQKKTQHRPTSRKPRAKET